MMQQGQPMRSAAGRCLAGASFAFLLACAVARADDRADAVLKPNKIIALIRADGCIFETVKPAVETLSETMKHDRATTRVIVDWPADTTANLDTVGKPSAFLAALEIVAPAPALPRLMNTMEKAFDAGCRADVYEVA